MIILPDFEKSWDYENGFYLTCDNTRISKILAQYELFKIAQGLPGAIVECGVFKGASFVRFAAFRGLFGNAYSHKLIGFDTFNSFPEPKLDGDRRFVERWRKEAGEHSISRNQLMEVLKRKGADAFVELIDGDITETVPRYVRDNPQLKISLLNLDTDVYEPAVTILENLWERIVPGGVLMIDDYAVVPGETKAVDEFFKGRVNILKFPYAMTPCYVVKS